MKEKLKELRKKAKLTQIEAAEQIGVGQSTISMWETGESVPRTELLTKLAQTYHCEIAELFS